MLVGYSPFYGEDEDELYEAIKNDQVTYPSDMSSAASSFLSQLFEREPAKRLGMKTSPHGDIRQHNFFSQINWLLVENFQIEPPFKPNVVYIGFKSSMFEFLKMRIKFNFVLCGIKL